VKFNIVIPARYASTRLPAKPLLDIHGKPMIIRVAERARLAGAKEVVIATDHPEIEEVVSSFGYTVVMTGQHHLSGTDRIVEVVEQLDWPDDTVVVNLQGDEPLVAPDLLKDVAHHLDSHPDAAMATICHEIHAIESLFNPNVVKVVRDQEGYALYFSRAPVPYLRDTFANKLDLPQDAPIYRHIGIYAYRASFLKTFTKLQPTLIERYESLEQLRALSYGYKIYVGVTDEAPSSGVDTHEDLTYVRSVFQQTSL
jgi:3-deoxy-manno-octulosonate cytidylyltransferase (CMP-KDO synthetase)